MAQGCLRGRTDMNTGTSHPSADRVFTWAGWVDVVAAALTGAGLDEAQLKAEWLVAHAAGCKRLELAVRGGESAAPGAEHVLRAGMERLLQREPLQYVLGTADFMGHLLRVDRRVLIPRPETEQLVEMVLADPELRKTASPRLADAGTGSGCIAIALAAAQPAARLVATDLSQDALDLARDNARRIGVEARIEFRRGDLLDGMEAGSLDAVVSNPPYVAAEEWHRLEPEVRLFEPRQALDGGVDGLDVVRRLVAQALGALRAGGRLFVEIGDEQGGAAKALTEAAGFMNVDVRRDLSGKDRILCARKL